MIQCTLGFKRCAIKNFGARRCQFHEHIFKHAHSVNLKFVVFHDIKNLTWFQNWWRCFDVGTSIRLCEEAGNVDLTTVEPVMMQHIFNMDESGLGGIIFTGMLTLL